MQTVFIGGSRHVCAVSDAVRPSLDRIIERRLDVVIGDAPGADRAVQDYLRRRDYPKVTVFCIDGRCRNNLGNWPVRAVASTLRRKTLAYHATKDRQMAEEADCGLMLWNGHSAGTLANVARLAVRRKPVRVYIEAEQRFVTVRDEGDWAELLKACPKATGEKVTRLLLAEQREKARASEAALF